MSEIHTIGSLFSGIGGLELGLELALDAETLWQVEQNPFCLRVLEKHWPQAKRHTDVRTVGASVVPEVDLVCGGFPCQDVSSAGRQVGLSGARSGLWCEFARIVDEIKPKAVVVENVVGLLQAKGGGLGAVLGPLAELGYDAFWTCLSASDFGASHRRRRVFVVAWKAMANAYNLRKQQRTKAVGSKAGRRNSHCSGRQAQPGVARSFDGFSRWVDASGSVARWGKPQHDWEPPRTIEGFSPEKQGRMRALGNAVVPRVSYCVGRLLAKILEAQS